MAILIKGMEMPKLDKNQVIKAEIRIFDGEVDFGIMTGGYYCSQEWTYYPLAEVPTPHGRLIEEKTFLTYLWGVVQNCRQGKHMPFLTFATVESVAEDTPTIVEAED